MNWRAVAAGFIITTAISVAIGITFWSSFLLAGVALAIDSNKTR